MASADGETSSLADRPALESEIETADAELVTRPLPLSDPSEQLARRGRSRKGKASPRRGARKKATVSRAGKLGRFAAVIALCIVPAFLLGFREKVVAAAPGIASLYGRIGLPVNLVGLSFANVRSTVSTENDATVLEVTGEIVNDGRIARTVPWLQISLESERGVSLYRWSAKAVEGEMIVGQTAPFRVRLTQPPPAASRVQLTFQDRSGRRTSAAD